MVTVLVAAWMLSGCLSLLTPEGRAARKRFDRCVRTLPILREEPAQPYRVLGIVEASNDNDLAWYACEYKADAVISTFGEDQVTTTTVGGGPYLVTGRSKTKSTAKLVGRAIRYGFGRSQVDDSPSDEE